MKLRVGLGRAAIVAGLALTAYDVTSTVGIANADVASFLAVTHTQGFHDTGGDPSLLAKGDWICDQLDAGMTASGVMAQLRMKDGFTHLTMSDIAEFTDDAIAYLCADDMNGPVASSGVQLASSRHGDRQQTRERGAEQ